MDKIAPEVAMDLNPEFAAAMPVELSDVLLASVGGGIADVAPF